MSQAGPAPPPLSEGAHAGFVSDLAWLTRETHPFFRFELLKIDRQGSPGLAHPANPPPFALKGAKCGVCVG